MSVFADIRLARGFQQKKSDTTRSHLLLNHGNYRKRVSKWKWTECEYPVQDRKDVSHISVRMSCAKTQLLAFSFWGSYAKLHGLRGLSKHYYLQLDPKLSHGNVQYEKYPVLVLHAQPYWT